MKKFIFVLTILVLMLSIAPPASVRSQGATSQIWTSSVAYYTPSITTGQLNLDYYQGTITYHYGPITLNPHNTGSLFIGSTSVQDGFAGSAVLSAN